MASEAEKLDIDALSKSIQENLQKEVGGLRGEFGKIEEKFSGMDKKIDSLAAKREENDEDLDDDLVVSKKDLKKLVASELENAKKEIKGSITESLSVSAKQKAFDDQAFEEFPFLSKRSSLYSKDFESDVQKEIKSRVSDGVANDDPRLLLDATRAVAVSNPKYLKLKREYVEEHMRELNNRDGSFSMRTNHKERGSEPTSQQLDLAKRLGMDVNKVKESFKNLKK